MRLVGAAGATVTSRPSLSSATTASVHGSNILAKLGAASRTEAGTIAHRAGLSAGHS